MATVGERIVAVGTPEECAAALPSDFEDVDLAGRTLVPGFVDAHVHPLIMCVFEQHALLDDCRSVADVLDAVATQAEQVAGEETIVGFQLDPAVLAERRSPTAGELDAASAGQRVVLVRRDGHHAVASTAALADAGITETTADPFGGSIGRFPDGTLDGSVAEAAVAPLMDLLPDVSMESLRAGADAWTHRLLSQGVTAISAICQTTAEGPSGSAGAMEALGWAALVDSLPFDIQTILISPDLGDVEAFRGTALHEPAAGRRLDAIKLFLDGTLGGRTACMHDPYADATTQGMRTMDDDDAYARMVAAHVAGLQICIHAIGDRTNRAAATLFERLLTEHPGDHRHRVEHASVLDAETIESFARLGISAVVQPINLRSERHWLAARVGDDRLSRTYPFRRLLDAGVTVAGSSDAPIEKTEVLAAMSAAIDRGGLADDQAVSPLEALGMYTTGAAAVRRNEGRLGCIEPGARADFVVLSDIDFSAPNARPDAAAVLSTVIGGVERYRKETDVRPRNAPENTR